MNEWLHYHTREQISAMAAAGASVVVPLAATEQHGDHLPVYTDTLACEHIAREAVRRAAASVPMLLAPTLAIGCSQHHLRFGGTISFTSSTYLAMLGDIADSLVTSGFRRIIFLNGHGGNENLMRQAASDAAVRHPVWTAAASYWSVSREALEVAQASESGMVPGHAGGFETSLVLALLPERVRADKFVGTHPEHAWIRGGLPGAFIAKHGELTGANGFTDAPAAATAERGRRCLEAIVGSVADWLVQTHHTMSEG
ncbi:MAG: creatininase family protein [Paenibacillaceae bacterium]|nr:creatininase family protein [Paenibacillaceae bacterium]